MSRGTDERIMKFLTGFLAFWAAALSLLNSLQREHAMVAAWMGVFALFLILDQLEKLNAKR